VFVTLPLKYPLIVAGLGGLFNHPRKMARLLHSSRHLYSFLSAPGVFLPDKSYQLHLHSIRGLGKSEKKMGNVLSRSGPEYLAGDSIP
jgi:hypothetical protein